MANDFIFVEDVVDAFASATNKELLESYKLIARTEGICSALEPMAAVTESVKRAKKMSKDKIVVISLCGRGEKDLDQIEEKIGKDFE